MIQVSNEIISLIDSLASISFVIAIALSFRDYKRSADRDNVWLLTGIAFVFLFIVSISNVLEWGGITSALDPAEDFIVMLVVLVWAYIFLNIIKHT